MAQYNWRTSGAVSHIKKEKTNMKTIKTYKRNLIKHLIDEVIDNCASWDVLMTDDDDWSNASKLRIRKAIDSLESDLKELI